MDFQELRFGGSTFSFMWTERAHPAMSKMQQLGLNDFDVLVVPGHLWIDQDGLRAAPALRQSLDRDGLRIESLNLPALDLNLASCVPEFRAYSVETYERTLVLASELQAKGVVVVPGRVSALLPPRREDTLGHLSESITRLADKAGSLGLSLHLESHPQTPIPTADLIGAFVDRVALDHVKIAYDVASAEFIGEDYRSAIAELGHRIGQIHLSDSTRTSWRHDALGEGSVDVLATLQAAAASRFEGVVILEVISPDPVPAMADSLRQVRSMSGV